MATLRTWVRAQRRWRSALRRQPSIRPHHRSTQWHRSSTTGTIPPRGSSAALRAGTRKCGPPDAAAEGLESPTSQPPLDELTLKFAIWARISAGYCVDIGGGARLAAAAALSRGGRVLAVDSDLRALEALRCAVPREQHGRLKLLRGALPQLELAEGAYSAVHVASGLERLSPQELQTSLRKIFQWLEPNGKVFVGSQFTPVAAAQAADIHLLDESVLARELNASGFIVEELSCGPIGGNRSQLRCAAVARRP